MPETLVIRLPEEAGFDAQWAVVDAAGTRIGEVQTGTLADAAHDQLQRQVLVLVPGTQTVTARATLPVRSAAKMLQVVPFALEDQLAGDVTNMHFAVGTRNNSGEVPVVVVARDTMSGWISALTEAGISARRLLPDTAGVPVTSNGMTVVILEHEAYLRDCDGDVFAVDHASVVATLELLVQPVEQSDADDHDEDVVAIEETDAQLDAEESFAQIALNVYLDDSSGAAGEALLTEIHARFPETQFRRLPSGLLPRLGSEAAQSGAPNLLQGDYAARGNLRKQWLPWRNAAGLIAALVLVGLTSKGVELFTYKSRYAALTDEIRQVYSDTYQGENVPSDPRLAFERRLQTPEASETQSDFLDGLDVLARALPDGANAILKSVNFNAGVMNLEILAADIPTLDSLRERVSQTPPWEARLTQTSPEDDKIEGRFQLQRTAP